MLHRLSVAALTLLALLPASWAAAQKFCGSDGEPCCCAEDERSSGPAFTAEDGCCCEVTPRDEVPPLPQQPRDLGSAPIEYAAAALEIALPPLPSLVIVSQFRKHAGAEPRAPPGPLYLRFHAFLC